MELFAILYAFSKIAQNWRPINAIKWTIILTTFTIYIIYRIYAILIEKVILIYIFLGLFHEISRNNWRHIHKAIFHGR